jgi:hypothetical protein
MIRSLLSWLRGGFRRKSVRRPVPQRRSFVPRVFPLEDRTLLSVQFTPAPYAVPANRPDTPLGLPVYLGEPVEPYLSVNAADPGDIAVSSQIFMRVSTSAGGRFTGVAQFVPLLGGGGDTSTTYDSAGRLFWVNLRASVLSGITIAQVDSANGGILNTHVVDQVPDNSFQDDKDFIAADPSNNNLYVIWTRFGPGGDLDTQVLMRYSSDQGVSWSAPVQVDNGSEGFVWPATIAVAPDHRVYAAYHSVSEIVPGLVPDHDGKIVVVRFNSDLTNPVRSIAELPGRADVTFNAQTEGFPRKIPGATFYTQGSAQPWVLADPVRPGNIYVISADSNNGFHQDYGDIRIARSTDYGLTWSSSLIETSSALFPNAAIDQNGDIVVAWYDNRRGLNNPAGHFKLDVYATYSTDGGLTFAPAFPVNDQTPGVNTPNGNIFDPDPGAPIYPYSPDPPPTTWIGEYFGLAISGGTAYVAWNGNIVAGFNNPVGQQVWMKSFAIRGSLTVTTTPGTNALIVRTMQDNPDAVEVIFNGQRQYAGLWSALTGITVNETLGNNTLVIDNTVAGTPVTVNAGQGTTNTALSLTARDMSAIQGPVTIHGGAGAVVILYDNFNFGQTTYTITGSSYSRPGAALVTYDNPGRGLTINGGAGNDTYDIVGTIPNPVTVAAGLSSNTLYIDDRSNTANSTYTVTSSSVARTGSGAISYSGNITTLLLTGGSGNNTYNVANTPSGSSTTLDTGSGMDTINLRGSAGLLFINGGGGADTITLSNSAATLGGIGHVIINDPSNRATVTVDDSGFAGSTTYTVTSTQVAAAAWSNFLLVYNNLASLNLNGSSGDDQFNIESTASRTATTITAGSGSDTVDVLGTVAPLTINSGGGGDTITISNGAATLDGIGSVTVNDPSNTATVTVDDSGFDGGTTYTLTSTEVTADAWPSFVLIYDNLASLNLNGSSGSDSFTIESTASATATTVNAGTGGNRFDLTPTAQYLAGAAGALNLFGGGADTLVFWDTANPSAETYSFDDVPSALALASVPSFATSWSGMAVVYLETNGLSTVNDPSATVLVDVPPP